nr:proteasomal ATPase associated factor 1 [Hymenolepis microstoma]
MSNQGIRIQTDWDKAVIEKDSSFWFHLYESNKVRYQKVTINGDQLTVDTPDVDCLISTGKTIRFRNEIKRLQSTFQSPDFRFSSVHKQPRESPIHLNSFDVNSSGGLAVSATSDGKVLLWETRSSDVRRIFDGHASEVYVSRFFPSGLVVLTGGADMQLRIWCAVTGSCGAVLRAGLGGTDQSISGDKEPGGHRSGVLDVDFIDRGRNIISLDRGGWLRLWDVSTQIAISALSVTPRLPGEALHSNCLLDDVPVCCVVKKRVSPEEATSDNSSVSSEKFSCIETSSLKPTTSGVTDKLVTVGCGSGGRALLFDISTSEARQRGPVAHLTLPSRSGSVTSCAVAVANEGVSPGTSCSVFNEYGLYAGGSSGELACWDLRNCSKPMLSCEAYKYGVCSLKLVNIPAQTAEGDSKSVPAFTCLIAAYRDGRVILRRIDQTGMSISEDGYSKCLELTGPETEAICGLSMVGERQSSMWTGTYSAQFFGYRRIAFESLFDL